MFSRPSITLAPLPWTLSNWFTSFSKRCAPNRTRFSSCGEKAGLFHVSYICQRCLYNLIWCLGFWQQPDLPDSCWFCVRSGPQLLRCFAIHPAVLQPDLSPQHTTLHSVLSCTLFSLSHFPSSSSSLWIVILQSPFSPSWFGSICRFNIVPSRILIKLINSTGPKKDLEESILPVRQWTGGSYFFWTVCQAVTFWQCTLHFFLLNIMSVSKTLLKSRCTTPTSLLYPEDLLTLIYFCSGLSGMFCSLPLDYLLLCYLLDAHGSLLDVCIFSADKVNLADF